MPITEPKPNPSQSQRDLNHPTNTLVSHHTTMWNPRFLFTSISFSSLIIRFLFLHHLSFSSFSLIFLSLPIIILLSINFLFSQLHCVRENYRKMLNDVKKGEEADLSYSLCVRNSTMDVKGEIVWNSGYFMFQYECPFVSILIWRAHRPDVTSADSFCHWWKVPGG
jgi:hypothetical protein